MFTRENVNLLSSLEMIPEASIDAEMDVLVAIGNGYSKIGMLMEYAEESTLEEYELVQESALFTEADGTTPPDSAEAQAEAAKSEKKEKKASKTGLSTKIKNFFRSIIHALKNCIKKIFGIKRESDGAADTKKFKLTFEKIDQNMVKKGVKVADKIGFHSSKISGEEAKKLIEAFGYNGESASKEREATRKLSMKFTDAGVWEIAPSGDARKLTAFGGSQTATAFVNVHSEGCILIGSNSTQDNIDIKKLVVYLDKLQKTLTDSKLKNTKNINEVAKIISKSNINVNPTDFVGGAYISINDALTAVNTFGTKLVDMLEDVEKVGQHISSLTETADDNGKSEANKILASLSNILMVIRDASEVIKLTRESLMALYSLQRFYVCIGAAQFESMDILREKAKKCYKNSLEEFKAYKKEAKDPNRAKEAKAAEEK